MDSSQNSTTRPDRVRAFFGVGSVATAALELCRQRPWMDVVGAVRGPASAAGARPPIPAAWTGVCHASEGIRMPCSTRPVREWCS